MAGHRKDAIDSHAKRRVAAPDASDGGLLRGVGQRLAQLVQALAGHHAGAHQGRVAQETVGDKLANFLLDHGQPIGIGQVALGQGDHAVPQPQQPQDFEMFASLRFDGIVGRHDQQGHVDARGAGQHVADEPLVPRHIDNAEAVVAQRQFREAQLDGDAAFFFLGQAIGVDAGQRFDERGLTVVDVARRAEDEIRGHDFLDGAAPAGSSSPRPFIQSSNRPGQLDKTGSLGASPKPWRPFS